MASGYLSMEVSDSVVKVCLISGKGKSARLSKAFMFRTPSGTVNDGLISNPEKLAEELKGQLSANGAVGVKNVVFTLVSGRIATREAAIPPVKENKIRSILDANMAEYFPIDISKYQIDYGMVKKTEENGNKGLGLTLMAAPLAIIESYVSFAKAAGLIIDAIDYAGNSLYQLMKSTGSKKVSILINVDCRHSFVTICQGDALIFQRMLPYGGNEYIEAYSEAADGDIGYVDALKACCIPSDEMKAKGVLSDDVIQDALSRVVGGIGRSMDFFNTLRVSAPLEEVILVGACAHLAGLREMVAETIGQEIVSYLEESPSASALGKDAGIIATYASAFGAAIAPVGLLPAQFAAGKTGKSDQPTEKKEASLLVGLLIFLVIAIASGFLAYTVYDENLSLTREKDKLVLDIENTRYIEEIEEVYLQYMKDATAFAVFELILEADYRNADLASFFEELEEKMPQDLVMLSAVCTNDSISMNVKLLTLEAAAKTLVAFRSFESVEVITVTSITENVDEMGIISYDFNITCRYKEIIIPTPEPEVRAIMSDDDLVG